MRSKFNKFEHVRGSAEVMCRGMGLVQRGNWGQGAVQRPSPFQTDRYTRLKTLTFRNFWVNAILVTKYNSSHQCTVSVLCHAQLMLLCGFKQLCLHAGCQVVSRGHTRGESGYFVACRQQSTQASTLALRPKAEVTRSTA